MRQARFSLKADSRFPRQQIYLRFTYAKGLHLRYFTGLTVPPEFWDGEKERAKADRKFPEHTDINVRLNEIEHEASQIAQRAKQPRSRKASHF